MCVYSLSCWSNFCSFHGLEQEMEGSSRRKRSRVEMLSPNYKLGKTLGYGSFGEVKLAEHKLTGLHVAIKILNRHEMKKQGMEEKGIDRAQPFTIKMNLCDWIILFE